MHGTTMKIMDIFHFLEFLFITAFGKLGLFPSSGGKVPYIGGPDWKSYFHHQRRRRMTKSLIEGTVGFWVMIPWVIPDVSKEATTLIFNTEVGGTWHRKFSVFHRDCFSDGSLLGLSSCSVVALSTFRKNVLPLSSGRLTLAQVMRKWLSRWRQHFPPKRRSKPNTLLGVNNCNTTHIWFSR